MTFLLFHRPLPQSVWLSSLHEEFVQTLHSLAIIVLSVGALAHTQSPCCHTLQPQSLQVSVPCPPPQQTPVLRSPCSLCLCAFAFFLCPLTKFHSSIEGVIKCPHRDEMFPSQYVPESFLALIEFPLATSFPILCFTLDSFCCILE